MTNQELQDEETDAWRELELARKELEVASGLDAERTQNRIRQLERRHTRLLRKFRNRGESFGDDAAGSSSSGRPIDSGRVQADTGANEGIEHGFRTPSRKAPQIVSYIRKLYDTFRTSQQASAQGSLDFDAQVKLTQSDVALRGEAQRAGIEFNDLVQAMEVHRSGLFSEQDLADLLGL